jgi:signal transduction histidine kinase
MRRRIVIVMILMTAAALIAILIPAFLAIRSAAAHAQEVELQNEAFTAVMAFEANRTVTTLDDHYISLYSSEGVLLDGDGPTTPDAATRSALAGTPDLATDDEYVIAAVPLSDGSVLRICEELGESEQSALIATALLGALAIGIAALSYVAAARLSRKLSTPLGELALSAGRLGAEDANDTDGSQRRSGIVEVDRIAEALRTSSVRVSTMLRRERRLTAYTSHQLRTPLAGMRLAVEAEIMAPRGDPQELLNELLHALDLVEGAVDTLITTYQGMPTPHESTEVVSSMHAAVARWQAIFELRDRSLTTTAEGVHVARVRSGTVDTVLDVLIENALRHGAGEVCIDIEHTEDAILIGVVDEGNVDDATPEGELFSTQRHEVHGIGLTLARTLAQAEGGRVVLTSRHPTRFSLIVPRAPAGAR